jgi:hypothetical protein
MFLIFILNIIIFYIGNLKNINTSNNMNIGKIYPPTHDAIYDL